MAARCLSIYHQLKTMYCIDLAIANRAEIIEITDQINQHIFTSKEN